MKNKKKLNKMANEIIKNQEIINNVSSTKDEVSKAENDIQGTMFILLKDSENLWYVMEKVEKHFNQNF